ncbi:ATPase, T2SS/T4P/T4SS family [Thiohalorhabdus denitrificans]|uniref:Type IV pilus assembly protein PilB n=1 Tax=Thiohalorhabdus denitrificans TaxID=381306 RepID=A0A1G5DN80_9GAMM|nr:ATPase, T2SS/T4P/T4SS family [Thiohalorhabdus denitrificans]SCY16136.1 type IV pilus assembly protein PilB [Thiohalorhabdus denitrificans]
MTTARPSDLPQELIESGLADPETLEEAREHARAENIPLDQALIDTGAVAEGELVQFVADRYHVATVDLDEAPLDADLLPLLPVSTARRYLAIPLHKKGHAIVVAMAEAWNVARVDEVRFSIGRPIKPVLAARSALREKLDELFPPPEEPEEEAPEEEEYDFLQDALNEMEDEGHADDEEEEQNEAAQRLLQESTASPIVKIVNDILIRAIHKGASDIHIEPQESMVTVRFRVDGALREVMNLPAKARNAIVSRIKVLGGMDISVARRPQDGRIKLHYRDEPLDLRVSTLPTYWGEKVVMRVLDQSGEGLELDKLGFLPGERERIEAIMHQPQGMLLVTGPTGSGKTTTLYSVLGAINQEDVNIITVEDPVEYQLAKINQVPVNPKAGMTFAAGLRSILRQDPNVIMVGEIRDQETAEIALESAETGHMVFSTLHTNSAAGAVTRFLDMGVPGYLLASSVSGVLAQRLLRRNCPECSEPVEVGEGLRTKYNIPEEVVFYEGKGCSACDGQGTKGRIGAYELLLADAEVREGIHKGVMESELVDTARTSGMHLMFEDGLIKAMQGKVSLTEVLRALELPPGVEVDGGRLWEESDKPWADRGPAAHRAATFRDQGEDGEGERRSRALVIGVEAATVKMLALLLEDEGLEVETSDSGRQGLDLIRHHRPELVVAEADAPELAGEALAETLRREESLRDIPLILIGEEEDVGREAAALGAGADDFLAKPLDPRRLLARVNRLLATYRRLAGEELAGKEEPHEPDASEEEEGEEAADELDEPSAPPEEEEGDSGEGDETETATED